MMRFLLNLLVAIACELVTLWLFYLLSQCNRANIIELGYRSESKRHKKENPNKPLWDRILHWSLCKEAKVSKSYVWIFFSLNLLLVIGAIVSVINACVLLFLVETRELLLYQLKFMFAVFFIVEIGSFFPSIFLLPSVQERYGIKSKKKAQKKTKAP